MWKGGRKGFLLVSLLGSLLGFGCWVLLAGSGDKCMDPFCRRDTLGMYEFPS